MYGYGGKILRINLSTGKIEKENLKRNWIKNFIGGRGINSKILYEEVGPEIRPLDPENRLIFGTGALTGTGLLTSGRYTITARSPLTGFFGDSNAGGHFAPELKWAGYDHLVFRGKAEKPVYVWINDDEVELRDATHLWGKSTWETDRIIKQEVGDPRIHISCIGPAGENLVRYASVVCDLASVQGKCGMGAVMGSKNLKAVAARGTKGFEVADPKGFKELAYLLLEKTKKNQAYAVFSDFGTGTLAPFANEAGLLPVRNAQQSGEFRGIEEITKEALKEKYFTKNMACFGCPIHCKHHFVVKEGPFAGERGPGIEFGVLGPQGPYCDNVYAPSILKIQNICNQMGICGMTTGLVIGAAMEWYQRGIITEEDTEGIRLEWGNYEAQIEMLWKIIKREGLGDILAEGASLAAKKIGKGAEKYISHCKGVDIDCIDPRPLKGYSLGDAVSTRGADNLRGSFVFEAFGMTPGVAQERFGTEDSVKPDSYTGKAVPLQYYQRVCTIADALGVCKFATEWWGLEITLKAMSDLFSAATGIEMDENEMIKAADRIYNLERAFQVRDGITRKDDMYEGRFMEEPVANGPAKGKRLDKKKWEEMLDEYYAVAGWDKKTGSPTRERLQVLGLDFIIKDLEKRGKLK